jgi:hypothetical protein
MTIADSASRARRRIVLIVILIGAVAIVALFLLRASNYGRAPIITKVTDQKNLTICTNNLKSLGGAMELHYQRLKRYPSTRSGVQFLLAPLKTGILEHTRETIEKTVRNVYVCPGDDYANAAIGGDVWEAFRDLDNIDPTCISYAGRNTIDFPLDRRNAHDEPIACCAGGPEGRMFTHRQTIPVLFLDQHVEEIDISALPGGDATTFQVGPGSPIQLLRKLNKDP